MMYMPSVFGENLMDDFMSDFDGGFNDGFFGRKDPMFGKHAKNLMKTDVKENEQGFELAIDLPGFKKDEIKLELDDGYLTISAEKNVSNDKKDESGKLIRQERYEGSMQRSFYIGEDITENEVKAKFEDGVLKLSVPKKEAKPEIPEKKYIAIEG